MEVGWYVVCLFIVYIYVYTYTVGVTTSPLHIDFNTTAKSIYWPIINFLLPVPDALNTRYNQQLEPHIPYTGYLNRLQKSVRSDTMEVGRYVVQGVH